MSEVMRSTFLPDDYDKVTMPLIKQIEEQEEVESKIFPRTSCIYQNSKSKTSKNKSIAKKLDLLTKLDLTKNLDSGKRLELVKELDSAKKLNLAKPIKSQKRTCTSYDYETSFYLKSIFFHTYSLNKKLSKFQRLEIQRKTGLDLRKITYWFSNHKRRSKEALEIYRNTIHLTDGKVSNYEEFIRWRRLNNLPDRVSVDEVAMFKASKTQTQNNMI